MTTGVILFDSPCRSLSIQEWAKMIKAITTEDGNLDCIPPQVSVILYNNSTQYLMWETPEYRKMVGGAK